MSDEEKATIFRALVLADKHAEPEDLQYNNLILKLREHCVVSWAVPGVWA